MKSTLPAKLAIVLSVASFFSYADCSDVSGTTVQNISFNGLNNCPNNTAMSYQGLQCELVQASGFNCVTILNNTTGENDSFGGPYVYTGQVYSGDTDDGEGTDRPIVQSKDYVIDRDTEGGSQASDVKDSFEKLQTNTEASLTSLQQNLRDSIVNYGQANKDLTSEVKNAVAEVAHTVGTIDNNTSIILDNTYDIKRELTDIEASAARTESSLDALHLKADAIKEDTFNAARDSYNAYDAAISASYWGASNNSLLIELGQAIGRTESFSYDAKESSNEALNAIYELMENGSGGSTEGLSQAIADLQAQSVTNSQNIVNAVHASEAVTNLHNELRGTNGRLDGLSQQLGDQLSGIQQAVENSSGGSGPAEPDTVLHGKVDAVKTAIETSTDQLSQYLTGIQDAIENQGTGGTGGPVSDSGTHDRLDAIKTAVDNVKAATDSVASAVNETKTELADSLQNLQASNEASAAETQNRLNDIKTAVSDTKSAVDAVKTATDSVTTAVNGVGDKIDGIGTKLDGIGDALNGDPDAVAGAGQSALDGLNQKLEEKDADDHWTKVFNDLIDEANNAVNDTDFGGYSSPGDFLEKSGLTKPSEITKMADLSGAACEPLEFNIHGKTYTYNLCTTITEIRNILYWLFAISTAFFVYVHFMRILTRERLT